MFSWVRPQLGQVNLSATGIELHQAEREESASGKVWRKRGFCPSKLWPLELCPLEHRVRLRSLNDPEQLGKKCPARVWAWGLAVTIRDLRLKSRHGRLCPADRRDWLSSRSPHYLMSFQRNSRADRANKVTSETPFIKLLPIGMKIAVFFRKSLQSQIWHDKIEEVCGNLTTWVR